jgi:hypothetical protein
MGPLSNTVESKFDVPMAGTPKGCDKWIFWPTVLKGDQSGNGSRKWTVTFLQELNSEAGGCIRPPVLPNLSAFPSSWGCGPDDSTVHTQEHGQGLPS